MPEPPLADPYAVLEVERSATAAEVRLAYLQQVRAHPPERDPEGFKRVREAYDVLRSPRQRAEIALLELGDLPAALDLAALREAPPPPPPDQFAAHLAGLLLADVDAAVVVVLFINARV